MEDREERMKRLKRSIMTVTTALTIVFASFAGCNCNQNTIVEQNVDFVDVTSLEEEQDTTENGLETSLEKSEVAEDNIENIDLSDNLSDNQEEKEKTTEKETVEKVDEDIPEETQEENTVKDLDDFIIYFSGIDIWGWTDDVSRSDVNIIAIVNPDSRHIQLINTPRDFLVPTPYSNGQRDKLTHAGMYGVENSMGTLNMLYDINIDYYLRMNFSGFEKIIDTVGGVDVYSEVDFTVDPIKHYTVGYNHLTGLEALAFVRERKAFEEGDFQRVRNQMALIKGMVKKVCTPEFLLNYSSIKSELTDMYRTNVPDELMADLIFNQLIDDTEWTVDTYSVVGFHSNNNSFTYPDDYSYVMEPDYDSINEAKRIINSYIGK